MPIVNVIGETEPITLILVAISQSYSLKVLSRYLMRWDIKGRMLRLEHVLKILILFSFAYIHQEWPFYTLSSMLRYCKHDEYLVVARDFNCTEHDIDRNSV